jgi:tetratricopeptide (TPR) repeat protein
MGVPHLSFARSHGSSRKRTEANKIAMEGADALKNKQWDKAVDLFRKATDMDPKYTKNLSAALQQRAFANASQHQYQEAIQDYTEALKKSPNENAIYEGRAYAEMMLPDYDAALKDYSKLIKMKPKEVRYLLARSYIYEVKKEISKALADTEKVLKLDPNNVEAKAREQRLLLAKAVKAENQMLTHPITPPPTTPTPRPRKK